MMKMSFTFLVILFFCLNATSNDYGSGKQKRKEPSKQKGLNAPDTNISRTDSVSAININGRQNSVQITSDKPSDMASVTEGAQKNNSNTIEINGEGNSVNINQSGNSGKVSIRQNGNRNQVNITQSNLNPTK
jgi:hypothetical protein